MDSSAVLKCDQGEEDVTIGRQHRVGCQSPSKVGRAFVPGGGPVWSISHQAG